MSELHLSPEKLLTTTRSVRKRLDFSRPVELEVVRECLELAMQAPTGGNSQGWHFMVVTDPEQRQALAEVYRKGWAFYLQRRMAGEGKLAGPEPTAEGMTTLGKVVQSAIYLAEHMHEVPVLVVPCIQGRSEGLPSAG